MFPNPAAAFPGGGPMYTPEGVQDPQDAPIYPGGPTYRQIEEWKARYGRVYFTNFGTDEQPEIYIWRTLSRLEFKELAKTGGAGKQGDGMWKEERLIEKCVLWPSLSGPVAINSLRAGIPTVLADQIMERSGFVPSGEPMEIDALLGVPEGLVQDASMGGDESEPQ